MTREITDKNLHLILPSKIAIIANFYTEDDKCKTLLDAIHTIYTSKTYKLLEQENSKYWHYGPVALYEELCQK